MYTLSMFRARIRKIFKKKNSSENKHFYSQEILLYFAWACLRNGIEYYVLSSFVKVFVNYICFGLLLLGSSRFQYSNSDSLRASAIWIYYPLRVVWRAR